MPECEASIIIPVLDNWNYTAACLEAVARTCAQEAIEVIVVDNASQDATGTACPALGAELFGPAFQFIRNGQNRNFGPACNQGAKAARGDFLIFLNNDTVPLDNWYRPLIQDFSDFADLGATGPLLVYPEKPPFGHTVQHLGVRISPLRRIGHLYQGIPAASPLAHKRRFFQVITAACMAIPAGLFHQVGMFDEDFINGFEDVELCCRLGQAGRRITVNPASVVVHHESKTHNRHAHDGHNAELLQKKCGQNLVPDMREQLALDNLVLEVSPWLDLLAAMPADQEAALDSGAAGMGFAGLKKLVVLHPMWKQGWRGMISHAPDDASRQNLIEDCYDLFPDAMDAITASALQLKRKDKKAFSVWLATAFSYSKPLKAYELQAKNTRRMLGHDPGLARKYQERINQSEQFNKTYLEPFIKALWQVARQGNVACDPFNPGMYEMWRKIHENAANPGVDEDGPLFSILTPVYNPKPKHLRAAINSVLAQNYGHWELCIADDASTNPAIRGILEEYKKQDSRIRVTFRKKNGHIAAATNTALAMAKGCYGVLLDQDDLLAADALDILAASIKKNPQGLLFYSDQDKTSDEDIFFSPYFKNNRFDWELVACQNCISHLGVYEIKRMRAIGGFRDSFRGSQDYDLALRFITGLADENIVHIPHVLYHWRAHATSTAMSVGTKNYAIDSARAAAAEWIEKRSPGAKIVSVPPTIWQRPKYPLPADKPTVSIVCALPDMPFPLREFLDAWQSKTDWPFELILVAQQQTRSSLDAVLENRVNVRLAICQRSHSAQDRYQIGADLAQSQILGFIGADTIPATSGWLEELVSSLWRPGIGVCGGKIFMPHGTIDHCGYMVDCTGRLKKIFHNHDVMSRTWFGWTVLSRTVDALDYRSFFTRRELWGKGLDTSLGLWAFQDYCLRLGVDNWRSIWWPFAHFRRFKSDLGWQENMPLSFETKWHGQVKPFSPNVRAESNMLICTS